MSFIPLSCFSWPKAAVLALSMIVCAGYSQSDSAPVVLTMPALEEAAKSLPHTGTLKKADNNYVYLSVSPEYETRLYSLLIQNLNATERKCLIPNHNENGEHVSLFYPGKLSHEALTHLPLGKSYTFGTGHVFKFIPDQGEHGDRQTVWYTLEVDSPDLQKLAHRYGQDLDYPHISIAVSRSTSEGECLQ